VYFLFLQLLRPCGGQAHEPSSSQFRNRKAPMLLQYVTHKPGKIMASAIINPRASALLLAKGIPTDVSALFLSSILATLYT
jgi:hypothetical protein